MDQKTQTPAEKAAADVIKAVEEILKLGGFVKRGGLWRSSDIVKAEDF